MLEEGETELVHVHTNTERQKASARALKMAVLFNTKHFDKVMDPVYNKGKLGEAQARADFKKACDKTDPENPQLEDVEIEWLWNYLTHYDNAIMDKFATIGW